MALDVNDFATKVRNWVHYDNLATTLFRQVQNARKVKDQFENQIITALKEKNMENAVIQIAGGRLVIADEKHSNPLNLSRIEELLHEYFLNKGGQDETTEIIKFLKTQRGFETTSRLKKQS
jgi:hypothetical protein